MSPAAARIAITSRCQKVYWIFSQSTSSIRIYLLLKCSYGMGTWRILRGSRRRSGKSLTAPKPGLQPSRTCGGLRCRRSGRTASRWILIRNGQCCPLSPTPSCLTGLEWDEEAREYHPQKDGWMDDEPGAAGGWCIGEETDCVFPGAAYEAFPGAGFRIPTPVARLLSALGGPMPEVLTYDEAAMQLHVVRQFTDSCTDI